MQCGNIASRTNRAGCIYGIRTYHIYIYIYIKKYIDNFPFTPQVWGSLRSPQLSLLLGECSALWDERESCMVHYSVS